MTGAPEESLCPLNQGVHLLEYVQDFWIAGWGR